jgi:hypothetical protein
MSHQVTSAKRCPDSPSTSQATHHLHFSFTQTITPFRTSISYALSRGKQQCYPSRTTHYSTSILNLSTLITIPLLQVNATAQVHDLLAMSHHGHTPSCTHSEQQTKKEGPNQFPEASTHLKLTLTKGPCKGPYFHLASTSTTKSLNIPATWLAEKIRGALTFVGSSPVQK